MSGEPQADASLSHEQSPDRYFEQVQERAVELTGRAIALRSDLFKGDTPDDRMDWSNSKEDLSHLVTSEGRGEEAFTVTRPHDGDFEVIKHLLSKQDSTEISRTIQILGRNGKLEGTMYKNVKHDGEEHPTTIYNSTLDGERIKATVEGVLGHLEEKLKSKAEASEANIAADFAEVMGIVAVNTETVQALGEEALGDSPSRVAGGF